MRTWTLLALMLLFPLGGSIGDTDGGDYGGWDQYRGGPDRQGIAEIHVSAWDVIGSFSFLDQPHLTGVAGNGEWEYGETVSYGYGSVIVETPAGTVVSARDHEADRCFFIILDETLESTRHDLGPCQDPIILQGYDRARQEILACHVGRPTEPVLVAYDLDMEVSWSLGPADMLDADDALQALVTQRWTCSGIAIEEGLFVPLRPVGEPGIPAGQYFVQDGTTPATPPSRLVHVIDESTVWAASIGFDNAAGMDFADAEPFLAEVATVLPAGILTTGLGGDGYRWIYLNQRDGTPVGGQSGTSTTGEILNNPQTGQPLTGSSVIVGRNEQAYAFLGGGFMTWDIVRGDPRWSFPDGIRGDTSVTAPITIWQSTAFIPTGAAVMALDSQTETWAPATGGLSGPVGDTLLAPPYLFIALANSPTLMRIDLQNFHESPRITLNGSAASNYLGSNEEAHETTGIGAGGLLPAPYREEIWAWNYLGKVTRLGEAEDFLRPTITVSDPYPRPSSDVAVAVDLAGRPPVSEVRIAWGDGALTSIGAEDGEAVHVYTDAGEQQLEVMAVFDDGRTATTTLTLDVGGTAPVQEAWLTHQFRDNPDASWGVVGLLVALGGAILALWRSRKRRGRLAKELDGIEKAAKASASNPVELAAAMQERRAHVRGLLLDGRIDEVQLKVLEDRIDELARGGRLDSLQGRFDYLPHGFVRQVQEMLADGRLSGWEAKSLEEVLDGMAGLSKRQKVDVRRMLREWAQQDA